MRIIIRQLCVPDYRRGLFEAIQGSASKLRVIAGEEHFAPSIRTINDSPPWLSRSRNVFLMGRGLAWQQGAIGDLAPGDMVVHEWNPRILSLWRDLLVCRSHGGKFVLWGHAWGKDGPNGLAFRLRHWLARRTHGVICYTESQAELTRRINPRLKIVAAPNACLSRADCSVVNAEERRDTIVYVGRLVANKKVGLLLDGFAKACIQDAGFKARLAVVGDGIERARLECRATELGIADRVSWKGHQSEANVLRTIYGQSFVSVSPGYVGLSLTQSFAFGVPALIAASEPHSPEIEAAREGVNARFFASDDPEDLAAKLRQAWVDWRGIESKRRRLSAWTAANYSFEVMAERFVEICSLVKKDSALGAGPV